MTALRILFVPMLERGHIHPLIGVLQQLQRAGHVLACCGSSAGVADQFAAAGIDCAWIPERAEAEAAAAPASSTHRTSKLRDPKRLLRWSALGISTSLQQKHLDELRATMRAFAPDVVCIDPMLYLGCVAAELEGLPWAAISPLMVSAADPAWRCAWIDVAIELQPMVLDKMRALGVANVHVHVSDAVSPWLNTMFVSEAFAPRAWSNNTQSWYLGPSKPIGLRGDETDFPWERLRTDVPVIYVSAGGGQSLSFEPATFIEICKSLAPDEAQFVCALQHLFDDPFVRELPASCIAVRYAPQRQLLERHASVVVTHGGINSVTECLTYGRPMLVVPIGHEQFVQARAVETQHAGLAIDFGALTAANCRAALLQLLDPARGFRRALEPVRESYAGNGAMKAAELIATLGRTRTPLPPPIAGGRA